MEEDDQLRRSQRDRIFTEKAAEFTLETKFKTTKICYKNYQLSINNFHKLLWSEKDEYTVKSAYSEWLDQYEEFLLSYDEVQAWISQSEQSSEEKRWKTYDA